MRIAFDAASGGTAAGVALVIGLALAASLVVWGANAVRMLLIEVMQHPKLFVRNGWLAKVKRNKPDYYYQHRFKLWLAKNGLQKSRFIDHDGFWETGRDVPVPRRSGQSKHLVKKAGG